MLNLLTFLLTISLVFMLTFYLKLKKGVLIGFSRGFPIVWELKGHAVVFGVTGSGKTSLVKKLISRLRKKSRVLLLDWYGEYGETSLKTLTPGDELSIGIEVRNEEDIIFICEVFESVFEFSEPQRYILVSTLKRLLGKRVSIKEFEGYVESHRIRSPYDHESKIAILRRLALLTVGETAKAFSSPSSIKDLLKGSIRVNLSAFKSETAKRVFSLILLKLIFNHVVENPSLDHKLVIIIEEAQNLAPPRRIGTSFGVIDKYFMELRKFGVSCLLIAQLPSTTSDVIYKDSELIIVHRLPTLDELELIGLSNLRERIFKLKPGQAYVLIDGNVWPMKTRFSKRSQQACKGVIPTEESIIITLS